MNNKKYLNRMIVSLIIAILAVLIGAAAMRGEGSSLSAIEQAAAVMQAELTNSSGISQPRDPAKAGEMEDTDIRINYLEETSFLQTIQYPGAAFLKVHFASMRLLERDYVTVSNAMGTEVYTYSEASDVGDADGGGFWAMSVMGDTVIIELHPQNDLRELGLSEAELRQYGVLIDRYTRGNAPFLLDDPSGGLPGIRKIHGDNDLKDVVCYQSSHPMEYERSRAVAKLLLDHGERSCTTWRVGPREDTMMTNEHCITSQKDLNAAEIWFNYQATTCGGEDIAEVTKVHGKKLLIDDKKLDFALFTVQDPESIVSFGYIELNPRQAIRNEEIYIAGHPGGEPMKFGIESDMNVSGICRVDVAIIDGIGADTDIGYYCDTEGGNSGGPLIARASHSAIGLHHFSGPYNSSVRMDLIWPKVKPHLFREEIGLVWINYPADGDSIIIGTTYRVEVQTSPAATGVTLQVFEEVPSEDSTERNLVEELEMSPYNFRNLLWIVNWTAPNEAREYIFIAEATFGENNQANSGDANVVVRPIERAMVNFTEPTDEKEIVIRKKITVSVEAGDTADFDVAAVLLDITPSDFGAGGYMLETSEGSGQWALDWKPDPPSGATEQRYHLTAIAKDKDNKEIERADIYVTAIDNDADDKAPPKVSIIEPTNAAQLKKGTHLIRVRAIDNREVSSVSVTIAGPEPKSLSEWVSCGVACYQFAWEVQVDGGYTIEAKGVDTSDNEGKASIRVNVGQAAPISISINLSDGQRITKPHEIQLSATGGAGNLMGEISFYIGSKAAGLFSGNLPYTQKWDPRQNGTYVIKVKVWDSAFVQKVAYKTISNIQVSREDYFEVREGIWQNVTPSISPPRKQFRQSEMVDTGKGLMLFSSHELWKWDGSEWKSLTPSPLPASWPSGEYHQMAYDNDRDLLVLFGPSRHLWEYDIKLGKWTDRTPTPLPSLWPDGNLGWFSNGFERRMVYDPIQKKVILVSSTNIHFWNGSEWTYVARNETWFWDGNSGTWQRIEAPITNDENRTVALDKVRNTVVLYSINDDWYPTNDRTWEFSGSTWQEIADRYDTWTPLLVSPNLVDAPSGVYLIGGYQGYLPRPSTIRREFWHWDCQRWTRIYAKIGDMPDTSYKDVSVAYDSMNNQLVLFTEEGQTWIYTQGPQLSAAPRFFTEDWPAGSGKYLGPGMELNWTPSSDANAAYYRIEFSEDGGTTWQLLDDRELSYGAFKHHHGDINCGHGFLSCLKPSFTYAYRVRVLDAYKNSLTAWSNVVTAKSLEWPAHVELAAPEPNLPEYPSGSVVRMNLQNTYGKNMQLVWQIFPHSAQVQYEILGGCQNGYLHDASANYCELRITQSNGAVSWKGGSTKLAAPLMALHSMRVVVIGTDALGYSSSAQLDLMLKQKSADPEAVD